MYSSDSDFLDSDIDVVAPRNSKTTPAPPLVYSFDDLQSFQESLKQTIFCAIDFETVDNHIGTELEKMSEIGVAIYDPRGHPFPSEATTNTSTSNTILEKLAKSTTAIHLLVEEWKHETETTCKAFWHRDRKTKAGTPHTARPYHCQFTRSTILGREQSLEKLKAVLQSLTSQNLTAEERANGDQRQVRILFWDSGLEDRIFRQAGIHLHELGSDIQAWDLQAWLPFRIRLNNGKNNGKAKGEEAFANLGVLGTTDHEGKLTMVLHNATNDTVAQLLAFLRFMVLKSGEWIAWFNDRINLSPISFDWLDESIYQDNMSRAPGSQRRHQPRKLMQGHENRNQRKHGQSSDAKQSSSRKEPPDNTTSRDTGVRQSDQQVTTMQQNKPVPEAANVAGTFAEIAALSQATYNLQLQHSDVGILGDVSEEKEIRTTIEQGNYSSGKKGGWSRKKRARKNKALKREECTRQIPGLS